MHAWFESIRRLVTFRWKDRSDHNRTKELTLPGVEFVRRYLRHVLPTGLRSVRYYGFCHPTAKANRLRVQLHSGRPVQFGFRDPMLGPDPSKFPAARLAPSAARPPNWASAWHPALPSAAPQQLNATSQPPALPHEQPEP